MEEPIGAFGIYAQEMNPKAAPIRMGVEGQAGTDTVRFWLANYYVKLVATPPAKVSKDASLALGAAIAAGLGSPGALPEQLTLFPSKGLVAGSIRYIPANLLGQSAFVRGFEAKYQAGTETSTLVIVPFAEAGAARAAFARYESFLSQGGRARSVSADAVRWQPAGERRFLREPSSPHALARGFPCRSAPRAPGGAKRC